MSLVIGLFYDVAHLNISR